MVPSTDHGLFRNGLRAVWILAVVWLELGTFRFALRDCRWPDTQQVCVCFSFVLASCRRASCL